MQIKGKRALVTGGAVRVGKTICLMLAEEGADVAFTYHSSRKEADETAHEIADFGVQSLAVQCDISDWEAVQDMAQQVTVAFDCIDILVNSAGLFERTKLPEEDMDTWRKVTRVSIDGTFYVTNSILPCMIERGGVIVNILDNVVSQAWPGFTAHAVAKYGMLALTKQFAAELSPGIRTNAVVPGPILPAEDMTQEAIDNVAKRTLLNRWGDPADAAMAVKYFIEADYAIGETLVVDGGERYGFIRKSQ